MKKYDITPVAKPRMTQRDKWAKRPAVLKYRSFCDEVRAAGMDIPECGCAIEFHIPMPKSWSKRKRDQMNGKPHRQRPDLDNILKAAGDAVYREDCIIHEIYAKKLWSKTGAIIIREMEVILK